MNLTRSEQIEVFYRHAMPGMTLKSTKPAPKPLVKRCLDCPRQISNSRVRCKQHQDEWLKELAVQIETPELLELVLERNFDPDVRAEALEVLKPHLPFSLTK